MKNFDDITCEELFEICKKKRENGELNQEKIKQHWNLIFDDNDFEPVPDYEFISHRRIYLNCFRAPNHLDKDTFRINKTSLNDIVSQNSSFDYMYIIFADINNNSNLSLIFKFSNKEMEENMDKEDSDGEAYHLKNDGIFDIISDHGTIITSNENFLRNYKERIMAATALDEEKITRHIKFTMSNIRIFGGFSNDFSLDVICENDKRINIGGYITDMDAHGNLNSAYYNKGALWP